MRYGWSLHLGIPVHYNNNKINYHVQHSHSLYTWTLLRFSKEVRKGRRRNNSSILPPDSTLFEFKPVLPRYHRWASGSQKAAALKFSAFCSPRAGCTVERVFLLSKSSDSSSYLPEFPTWILSHSRTAQPSVTSNTIYLHSSAQVGWSCEHNITTKCLHNKWIISE